MSATNTGNTGKAEPGVPAGLVGGELMRVPVKACIPTPDCKRGPIQEKSPEFQELLKSIVANGVIVPVIVRPHPHSTGGYDLRAGKRRLLACKLAGLDEIPALVYTGMDDETAWRVTYLENAQRQDLAPIEQGAMIQEGLAKLKGDARTLAAMLGAGWSERRVRMFARLEKLTPKWRELAASPDYGVSTWSADHLALIARYDPKLQDEIADDAMNTPIHEPGHELSLKDLEETLNDHWERRLSGAPWPVEDARLVAKAGACMQCPKRSSCAPGLFDDQAPPAAVGKDCLPKGDRCLDVECWERKSKAWVRREQARLQAENPDAVAITSHWQNKNGAISSNYYEPAKKGAKGAVPAICVDGEDAGQVKYVVVDRKRMEKAEKARARCKRVEEKKPKTVEEQRAELAEKRIMDICALVSVALGAKKAPKEPARPMLERMLSVFGADGDGTGDSWDPVAAPTTKRWVASATKAQRRSLWDQVRVAMARSLNDEYPREQHGSLMIMVGEICVACAIDLVALRRQAEKKLPEPKEWAAKADPETIGKKGESKPGKSETKKAKKSK